jgi:hypothetical protein
VNAGAPASPFDDALRAAAAARAMARELDAELRRIDVECTKMRGGDRSARGRAERAADALARVQGFGPWALWQRLRGRSADLAAAASRAIDDARAEQAAFDARLEPLLVQREAVAAQLAPLAEAEAQHAALQRDKIAWLERLGGDVAARHAAATARLLELRREQKQTERMVEFGRDAESALMQARDRLGRASSWATVDLFGGGPLAGLGKHTRFDEARTHLLRAQRAIQEIAIGLRGEARALANLDIGIGMRLADLLLDGFLVDLLTGHTIRSAQERVRDFLPKLRDAVLVLERQRRDGRIAIEAAQLEYDAWLEGVAGDTA